MSIICKKKKLGEREPVLLSYHYKAFVWLQLGSVLSHRLSDKIKYDWTLERRVPLKAKVSLYLGQYILSNSKFTKSV